MRRRRTHLSIGILAVAALALIATSFAIAGGRHDGKGKKDDDTNASARMDAFQENPSVSSLATGTFRAEVANDKITYRLDWKDLSGPPLFAHVHISQRGVNGGVSFFLCGGGGKPVCPQATSGTVTGTVVATDVLAIPAPQQFVAGDLATVLAAMRAGATYANMHTTKFPGGEIRGQIKLHHGHGHGDPH